jgi:tetratricopeptide (TPR) repeat protein
VLGLRRSGDLGGRLVPDAYLDYLRSGDGAILDPVLAHNRADLLSLLLLGAEAGRFLARARSASEERRPRDAEARAADLLVAARVLYRAGEEGGAAELLERCLAGLPAPAVRMAARELLAYIWKRQGSLADACRLWEEQLDDDPTLVAPVEELAKVDEHRRHDLARALARVESRLENAPLDAGSEAALLHRRKRLARKLGLSPSGDAAAPLWRLEGPP